MSTNANSKSGAGIIVLQVIAGLVVVYIIYLLLIWVLKTDKIKIDKLYSANKQEVVNVLDGFVDSSMKKTSFNTTMPIAFNYLPIRPSINIKGGSQFTYSFWINIGSGAYDNNAANKVLLLKGSDIPYDFTVTNINKGEAVLNDNQRLVYCPMIKFGSDLRTIEARFNTLDNHDEALIIQNKTSDDSLLRNNLFSMIQNSWVLFTFTFEDNVPINEFENGIMVKFYVNDAVYKTGRYSSALKQNYGDLFVLPNDDPLAGIKIADMRYYNYVVPNSTLTDVVRSGPDTSVSKIYMKPGEGGQGQPSVLSHMNLTDMLNA